MNRKYLVFSVLLIVSMIISGCGPSAEQVATMTAAAWTPTPLPTSTSTPFPTQIPIPTRQPISAEDRANANQAFANGLMVYLFDPQPQTVTKSDLGATLFSLRYILSKNAKPVNDIILVYNVNNAGDEEFASVFRQTSIEDWTSETGEITFEMQGQGMSEMMDQIFAQQGIVKKHVDPDFLGIVLVAADSQEGQLLVTSNSNQLSNPVKIPVSK